MGIIAFNPSEGMNVRLLLTGMTKALPSMHWSGSLSANSGVAKAQMQVRVCAFSSTAKLFSQLIFSEKIYNL